MRNFSKYLGILCFAAFGSQMQAQQPTLDNFKQPDQRGINVFEAPKDTITNFDGLEVRLGGAFAIQFQALDHENSGGTPLIEIGDNFNLPTANLDLDVQLYDGVRMHLRTYLSSRHHPEPYVKGGYIQIDKLDFVKEGFLSGLMDYTTIKIGHMENNYGDAHFRRTDNAQAIYNPFVGNYIMDAFTTEVGGEVYYRRNGFLGMVGLTNGKLNQSVAGPGSTDPTFLAKLGYDNYISDDVRFRLTGSMYHTNKTGNAVLYGADRAGSRYYLVMEGVDASPAGNFTSGRYNPGFGNELTAFMVNPFIKVGGLEFFGTYEVASGKRTTELDERSFTQLAGDLVYRFGIDENFYVGARYNTVSGEEATGNDIDISRFQLGGGWFMTKNILAKVEYVNQQYDGFDAGTRFHEGQFNGLMVEAAISF